MVLIKYSGKYVKIYFNMKITCSEVPGLHVFLSSYAARLISCGTGVLSSLSPFLGCLSGASELG